MKNILFAVFAIAVFLWMASTPSQAAEAVLELDPAQTQISFTLSSVLHTVHGSFQFQRGTIRFDPDTGNVSGEVVVSAASGKSGNDSRDRRMHKEILESERYPDIIFTPDHIEGKISPSGASQVQVHGLFKIHGTAHEMTLPVQVQAAQNQIIADAGFTIPYVRWGLKNPSTFILRVSDKVDLHIHAVGRLSPAGHSTS